MEDKNPDLNESELRAELARALPELTMDQVAEVSPNFVELRYGPGQTVIQQGDPPDRFYILVDGRVEILHENLQGESHLVGEAGPGDYFGETGLLAKYPRSATVRVSNDAPASLLALDREHFQKLLADSRATEVQIAREMLQRLITLSRFQG